MTLQVDTHTHTILSGHAYSTINENAAAAFDKGLQAIVLADHGPAIPGCPPQFIITSVLRHMPEYIEGIRVVKGVECNILDHNGRLDIDDQHLGHLEFAIASMHGITIEDGGQNRNTDALIYTIRNPYIDVIGHPGNPAYPIHVEPFVREVARLGKLIEINNHSFEARPGSHDNCLLIAQLCRQYGVRVVVGSDAHWCGDVGTFPKAMELLHECAFPEELIVSADLHRFTGYLQERRTRIG